MSNLPQGLCLFAMKYTTVLVTVVQLALLVAANPIEVRSYEAVAGAVFGEYIS